MTTKSWKESFKDPLKIVNYKIDNLNNVWEKIISELAKEDGLTQAGIDLSTKRLSYAYHPDYYTIEKLTQKIESLGGIIVNIKE